MTDEKLDAAGKLAEEVEKDFLKRREERRFIERGWLLNMNFVNGSQYCDLDARGELAEEKKEFYWQERRVFNHIAPVIDSRLSKLSRIRPALTVRAASEDENDRRAARLASAILAAVQEDCDADGVMTAAAIWSEVCALPFTRLCGTETRATQWVLYRTESRFTKGKPIWLPFPPSRFILTRLTWKILTTSRA